ncbi:MAG: hypothetical protein MUD01_29210, partial [Chloroflexaceae bacterium]|nr:hypothetical protein [Chloroflexaceae bacterium]
MTSCSLTPNNEQPEEGVIVIGPFRFREVESVRFPEGLRRRAESSPPPVEQTAAASAESHEKTSEGGACSMKPMRSFTICPKKMSLDEARNQLPFPIHLPTWVPAGFELQEEVRAILPNTPMIDQNGNHVPIRSPAYVTCSLMWRAHEECYLGLYMRAVSESAQIVRTGAVEVPPGGVQAVLVQGYPAALKTAQFTFTPYAEE